MFVQIEEKIDELMAYMVAVGVVKTIGEVRKIKELAEEIIRACEQAEEDAEG